jgi:hypothetical protein
MKYVIDHYQPYKIEVGRCWQINFHALVDRLSVIYRVASTDMYSKISQLKEEETRTIMTKNSHRRNEEQTRVGGSNRNTKAVTWRGWKTSTSEQK